MRYEFESKDIPVWEATTHPTDYGKLEGDDDILYDLVIVGGGITGISGAHYAQKAGLKVALIEKMHIVQWTTGGTTAKLSAQHYFIYHNLVKRHGRETALAYANANMHGIDEIERITKELDIDSDFARRNAYIFSQLEDKVDIMKQEAEVAKSLGLPASFVTEIELPYEITGALKFENQAQFHPRKYLLPIAGNFVKNGGVIYEDTEATDVETLDDGTFIVKTKSGNLRAKHIFEASAKPFYNRDLFEGRYWSKVSYGLAVELSNPDDYPRDMYLRTDNDIRTTRSMPWENGKQLMIFGGLSHNASDWDPDPRFEILEKEVHKTYDVKKIHYRWLADDLMPYDKIPFIGELPDHKNIYVATGFRAWGLAWGVTASEAIINTILGKKPDWMHYFSLDRLKEPLNPDDISEAIGN